MLSDSRGQTFQVSNKTLPKKTEKKLSYWFQVAPFFQVNNFRENGKLFAMLSASPGQTTQKKNFSKNQKKNCLFDCKSRIFFSNECFRENGESFAMLSANPSQLLQENVFSEKTK